MFLLGIDGGGTSSRLELRYLESGQNFRKEFGSFNLTGIGRTAFVDRLHEIFQFCGDMGACASLCIGGAGVTKTETGVLVQSELKKADFHGVLKLCGDHEIALRGAMQGPGCILIAGTGSIAYGINEKGQKLRIGGYGHLIDDRGSGYAIGRDALALTVQTLDECISMNPLADAVMRFLNAKNAGDIVNYVYDPQHGKTAISALAPVVLGIAEAGDPYGLKILQKNSDDLTLMVSVLVRRLGLEAPCVALAGGLLDHENMYRSLTKAKISEFAAVVKAEHDPLSGAVMLAEEALRNFQNP